MHNNHNGHRMEATTATPISIKTNKSIQPNVTIFMNKMYTIKHSILTWFQQQIDILPFFVSKNCSTNYNLIVTTHFVHRLCLFYGWCLYIKNSSIKLLVFNIEFECIITTNMIKVAIISNQILISCGIYKYIYITE